MRTYIAADELRQKEVTMEEITDQKRLTFLLDSLIEARAEMQKQSLASRDASARAVAKATLYAHALITTGDEENNGENWRRNKIPLIKKVREFSGLGLKDAKDVVDFVVG